MTDLTEPVLRRLAADKVWGNTPPYDSGDAELVESHLEKLVELMTASTRIRLKADFGSYGSGSASYVDIFCWLSDGSGVVESHDGRSIDGLRIYLGRDAPFAVWAASSIRENNDGGGSFSFIDWEDVGSTPAGAWSEALKEIEGKLKGAGLRLLTKQEVEPLLPRDIHIHTLASRPFRVFDAVFHWED